MKKILLVFALWLAANHLLAQTIADADLNYVRKTTVRKEGIKDQAALQSLSSGEKSTTTQFYDTWGRNLQTVQHQASPQGNDIVQLYYYDNLGRPAVQYIPYTVYGIDGYRYRHNAIADGHPATTFGSYEQGNFYAGQTMPDKQFPYTLAVFDNSPLNQVVGQTKLGLSPYRDYYNANYEPAIQQYSCSYGNKTGSNGGTPFQPDHQVRNFVFDADLRTFDGTALCQAKTLLITESKDEAQSNYVIKDARGRTIVQRKNGASWGQHEDRISTYSIYNDLDQLVAVIQPEGIRELATRTDVTQRWKFSWGDDFCKRYVFLYEYDEKGQMIAKTVPNKERQQFFYDDLGRLVAAQEAKVNSSAPSSGTTEQPAGGLYIFTYKKYDIFGREIMAGTFEAIPNNLVSALQNGTVSAGYALYENKEYDATTLLPYTNNLAFPHKDVEGISNLQVLHINYYDDYNPQNNNATVTNWFYKDTEPFIATQQPYTRIKGKPTFGLTKILNLDAGEELQKHFWEFTALFYDEYGHTIQTQSYQLQWGIDRESIWDKAKDKTANSKYDIATSLYDAYKGELLKTQLKHGYPESTQKENITIQNRYLYDHAGRLTHTYQQHLLPTEEMPEILVTKNNYNEVEKNTKTQLHSQNLDPTVPDQDFAQEIDYAYTINGWLHKVNDLYGSINDKKLFALAYEYQYTGIFPSWAFGDGANTNGMVSQTAWASKRSTQIKGFYYTDKRYNYATGEVNGATFSYANSFGVNPKPERTRQYRTDYDLNGNITLMQRSKSLDFWDWYGNIPRSLTDQIDNLSYDYGTAGNRSNQLKNITENATFARTYEEGAGHNDFRVRRHRDPDAVADPGGGATAPPPTNTDQYQYDDNGNLLKDFNKAVTFAYNYLQLPTRILFWGDKSTLHFTYNAAGERLQQQTKDKDNTVKNTIEYVNGFVYENGRLKSFGLPNGQVVNVKQADNSYKLEYEYHYRDHIGNLRLAFRVKASKKEYKLTGERNVLPKETEDFGENGTTSGGYTTFTRAIAPQPVRTGEFSIRLWVSEMIDGQESRIFKRIPVEAGTKLEMSSFAHYFSPYGSRISQSSPLTQKGGIDASKSKTPPLGAGGLALAELGAAVSVGSTQIGEQKSPQVQFNLFGLVPLAKQVASKLFLAKPKEHPAEETDLGWFNPFMAGMKFTFYDENGNQQYTETIDIGMIRPERWGELLQTFTAPNKGNIEVEIFNYMVNRPVYFDDWHITLTENPKPEIVQEVAYDPWGLVMQDESYFKPEMGVTPPSGAGGLFLFNGKELQTYADLHLYDYHWRQYDPQLGRWHSPDPADQFHGLSGYAYCANNPVMLTDPDGRWIHIAVGAVIGGLVNLGVKAFQGKINSIWDGVAAFGIGAAAGALGAATGGASLAATGLSATSLGGLALSGAVGAAFASPVQGLGNMAYFGDPYSPEQWGMDIVTGAVAGVVTYGAGKAFKALFPKTTQSISDGVRRIEQKIKNWFKGVEQIPRTTTTGASGGSFETGDLIFEGADDVLIDNQLRSTTTFGGLSAGDVRYSGASSIPVNLRGVPYPQINVAGYGIVSFPSGPYAPNNSATLRAAFTRSYKNQFRTWWEAQGRQWPSPSQGSRIDIHHIKPLKWGGTNAFENLVPLDYNTQHRFFTSWWSNFN